MARQARVLSPKGLYYIELKGERLFLRPEDKEKFIEIAAECFSDGKIYGTFLSDTLIKMVVKANDISAVMKSLSVKYARYINKLAQTSGKIFSGRFKSEPLMSEADAEKMAGSLGGDTPKPEGAVKPRNIVKKTTKSEPRTEQKPQAAANTGEKAVKNGVKNELRPEEKPEQPKPNKNLPSWLL